MDIDIRRLGLIDFLFRVLAQSNLGAPEYSIALFFLQNYNRIGELSIYDVAEECFVSRSSVRRFCMQIGCENFQEFKKRFKSFDFRYNYFMQMQERPDYRKWYAGEVMATIQEVDELITQKSLEDIAQRIYESKTAIFLSSYTSVQCLLEFQRPLVLLNKIVRVMTDSKFEEEELIALTEADTIFMVSTMGNFARKNLDIMLKCRAHKLLLTTSRDSGFTSCFDTILYLTKQDYSNVKSVQGKYGAIYFFDMLYHVYLKKYGER